MHHSPLKAPIVGVMPLVVVQVVHSSGNVRHDAEQHLCPLEIDRLVIEHITERTPGHPFMHNTHELATPTRTSEGKNVRMSEPSTEQDGVSETLEAFFSDFY